MEPYHFGPRNQLFGVFHAPTGAINDKGVLIVPPLFNDYMRSHRMLRQIALNLSGRGYAVLRFDLRGTGNSFGELAEITLADWTQDVGHALSELRDLVAAEKVSALAVRHGARLLAEASQDFPLDQAVLLDPVLTGTDIAEAPHESPRGTTDLRGFRASSTFIDSWMEPPVATLSCAQYTEVLTSGRPPSTASARTRAVDFDCTWENGGMDEIIYSRELMDTLCNAL